MIIPENLRWSRNPKIRESQNASESQGPREYQRIWEFKRGRESLKLRDPEGQGIPGSRRGPGIKSGNESSVFFLLLLVVGVTSFSIRTNDLTMDFCKFINMLESAGLI